MHLITNKETTIRQGSLPHSFQSMTRLSERVTAYAGARDPAMTGRKRSHRNLHRSRMHCTTSSLPPIHVQLSSSWSLRPRSMFLFVPSTLDWPKILLTWHAMWWDRVVQCGTLLPVRQCFALWMTCLVGYCLLDYTLRYSWTWPLSVDVILVSCCMSWLVLSLESICCRKFKHTAHTSSNLNQLCLQSSMRWVVK